jgi:L-Ala-D/L-Glu epimerase
VKLSARRKYIGLKTPFRVSFGTIDGLETVEVCAEHDGVVGRGECCPMAIYGQDAESTALEIEAFAAALKGEELTRASLQALMPAGSARNALDCALWDLEAKLTGRSAWELAGLEAPRMIASDVTIGIMPLAETVRAAEACRDASMIKLKLGSEDDIACLHAVRSVLPSTPLFVDVNAGWTLEELNRMAPALAAADVFMIEQPLPPDQDEMLDDYRGAVPLCADESCHVRADLDRLAGRFDYINIKLDKAGGLTEALALAAAARERGFRLMVGCMLGTGLAIAPAYLVASLCEIVDLDAPLIVNDPIDAGVRHDGSHLHLFGPQTWG